MITAILKEGISYKTCNQCKYETSNIEKMLKHLNDHNLEEKIALQSKPMVYRRVLKE